ncbi:hypothetical protein [Rhizobium leguminosarum]|nr:hypothetical protein [Rhizobium leguminosarum]
MAWLFTTFFGVFIAASFGTCMLIIVTGGVSSAPVRRRRRN